MSKKFSKEEILKRINRLRLGKNSKGGEMKDWASGMGQRIGDIFQVAMDIVFEEFAKDNDMLSKGGGKVDILNGDRKQIDGRLFKCPPDEDGNKELLSGQLNNELSDKLKTKGLSKSGTKDEMVERLLQMKRTLDIIGESKWLKDQKHQNDKGAWITNLPNDVCIKNPGIRGILALLGGPWEGTAAYNTMKVQRTEVVLIPFDIVIEFLQEIGLKYELDEDKNLKAPKETYLKLCDLEEAELNQHLHRPYTVWAEKLLKLPHGDDKKTIREAMMEALSNISKNQSKTEEVESNGYVCTSQITNEDLEVYQLMIPRSKRDAVRDAIESTCGESSESDE